jgi:hypothetical protein
MTEREQFEAWVKGKFGQNITLERIHDRYVVSVELPKSNMYASIQMMWEAWQAACSSLGESVVTADAYQIGGDHYKELAVQPWSAMQSWMSDSEFAGFLRGNAIKYLARAGRKGDALQDLQKAMHYLAKLVSMKQDGSE